MTAPVILISFNRPDATRRTFEAIREAEPAQLFLIADGPRPDHPDDASTCEAVRRELEAIDWPCQVYRRYSDGNEGPEATIELGLDWVFDHVEEAIILEDDCLPNADFFGFCSELLQYYRDDEVVWHIGGRAPTVPPEVFAGADYGFAAVGPTWGWATWRRAWLAHRRRFPRAHDGSPSPSMAEIDLRGSRLITRAARRYFADIARDRAGDAWDSYWSLSILSERGVVAIPKANLIENIGFGAEASHTRTHINQRQLEAVDWPLTHPADIAVNPVIERLCERIVASHLGRVVRFIARHLGEGRVRDVARSAARAWRQWRVPVR